MTQVIIKPPREPRPYPVPWAESPAITRLARGEVGVAEFWRRVAEHGTPLIEPADDVNDRILTFLWRGERSVFLRANKLAEGELEPVPGTDVRYAAVRVRADWRGSYQLTPAGGKPGPDPLARANLPAPSGPPEKSLAELPDAPAQPWLRRSPDVPAGELGEHTLPSGRRCWAYTPPGHQRGERLPLLVLLDGDGWIGDRDIAATLDNLIAAGRIPRMVAALPDSVSPETRSAELTCRDAFVEFLAGELAPWAEAELGATGDPARTIVAGQSLSGLAAAFTGLRAPARFGNVLSQSGSYWFSGEWLTGEFADAPRGPVRFYLEVGLQEWVILDRTRKLRDVLRRKNYPVHYTEFNGGHDYACWRGGLADGLIALTNTWSARS
ncbi:alpha/beta hydrolase-fold protein [Amycolatopsis anabasis]|uniref:alpha/beta hydrolase-fold protein n=1 Tax=Amycolatopsis anabasis TaxID=1840409 RepID=UPI00131A634E|nr:alpha/beta hydrolase-fold protein [Amycolatopsis anabasis]